MRRQDLGAALEGLVAQTSVAERIAKDPVQFPRRYRRREDVELAAALAAGLAYGRVAAFRQTLEVWFAAAEPFGGPAGLADALLAGEPGPELGHRWTRADDLRAFLCALRSLQLEGGLEPAAGEQAEVVLESLIGRIRAALEVQRGPLSGWSRGLRTLVPSPADGSACKRWCLFLRWMVRPADGVDLGLWVCLSPATLILPLDTHTARIGYFLGLVQRIDGRWKTAVELTRSLAEYCPTDPTRYDFALAHLGISGGCRGYRVPEVCTSCPLDRLCQAPSPSASPSSAVT